MIHFLTVGHLDAEALRGCAALAVKPLPEAVVRRVMGEFPSVRAEFKDGYVVLPWHGLGSVAASEEMAIRLQSLTGCQIADRRNGRLIEAAALERAKKVAG
jgi:hypothetical protein